MIRVYTLCGQAGVVCARVIVKERIDAHALAAVSVALLGCILSEGALVFLGYIKNYGGNQMDELLLL